MSSDAFSADPSNSQQAEAWDGDEGAFWTAQSQRFDDTMAASQGPFLIAAAIRDGEHVLDVGCGTGQLTRDVARLTPSGSALGVDLSSQMLALARATAAREGLENVRFHQADAQIYPFERDVFDLVVSRMGSMFFGDPVAAFTNLWGALRPGGRLALLTWQGLAENEWLTEFRSAMAVGRELPVPPSDAPSPFALSDPVRVRHLLAAAGFVDVSLQGRRDRRVYGPDPDDAFDFVSTHLNWMLDGLDDAGKIAALAALRSTIDKHTDEHGVSYQSATWIIRAHKPGVT